MADMKKETDETLGKLKGVMGTPPVDWREAAQWRKDNRRWLRVSGRIATRLLDTINRTSINGHRFNIAAIACAVEVDTGINRETFAEMLNGAHNFTLDEISKLEEYFGIDIFTEIIQ